jgi:hypothetical protein
LRAQSSAPPARAGAVEAVDGVPEDPEVLPFGPAVEQPAISSAKPMGVSKSGAVTKYVKFFFMRFFVFY